MFSVYRFRNLRRPCGSVYRVTGQRLVPSSSCYPVCRRRRGLESTNIQGAVAGSPFAIVFLHLPQLLSACQATTFLPSIRYRLSQHALFCLHHHCLLPLLFPSVLPLRYLPMRRLIGATLLLQSPLRSPALCPCRLGMT